uniref:glycoside hydrolase family 130 protein n=1 Tax=Sphingomonas sp. TaxID=28214 RepID=UPI0025F3F6B3|nr:glycosidase [Sphingomonas sp.]
MVAYVVEALDDVKLSCGEPLKSMDWMSPFVWEDATGIRIMVRGVPDPLGPTDPTGVIWSGTSSDGLTFMMSDTPAIDPGPDPASAGGVEDPTVVVQDDGVMVFYTGVDGARQQGSMLVASGRDLDHLEQRAVMLKAPEGEGNIKEATLAQAADGSWRLFYEYAQSNASRIGLARAPDLGGEWQPIDDPFTVREDGWDKWHLSTGPMVQVAGQDPVMFYNGATADARWRIGWVSFDADFSRVTGRGLEPVLMPPPAKDRFATDIAFAASALVKDDLIYLYYSLEDRRLARATIRRFG